MKAWILAVVLAVTVFGGAALAVASDGDTASDSTVAVDVIDFDAVFVAQTLDAVEAYNTQYPIMSGFLEVPVFADIANAEVNLFGLIEHASYKRGRAIHVGKLTADGPLTACRDHECRLAKLDLSHPLLC